jgi:hypothetical protein
MREEWRVIPSLGDMYEASSLGEIRSWHNFTNSKNPRRDTPRIMKGGIDDAGYRKIGYQGRPVRFHRLICEAFHGPAPEGRNVVRHLDGDRLNNRPENLAWGTYAENSADCVRLGEIKTGDESPSTKSVCLRGHARTEENLYYPPKGGRQCRPCKRANKRRLMEKVKIPSSPFASI